MPQVKIKVPKSVMGLPEADKKAILGVLAKAVRLPSVMPVYTKGTEDEHNMWSRNSDPLAAEAEDHFYTIFSEYTEDRLARVFEALDLPPVDGKDLKKAFDPEYWEWKGLQKANRKRSMSDLVNVNKKKRDKFLKYLQDMNPFSKKQLQKLDGILKQKLPDYAKIAEDFMTRAGFIGKIRSEAERENFSTMGALIDRYPSTIEAAEKEGVVLTLREQKKKSSEGRKVKILPLTKQESRAVQYATNQAAEKLAEVDNRHIDGIRQKILQAQRERWTPEQLAQELYQHYGDQNRDWRRVAITELSFATNDAYISSVPEGETVVGMGAANACKHCKKYVIGKTFTVTHKPPQNTYNHEMNYVWAGKSNYGRKVAAWIPAVPMHPNCRCRWHRVSRFYKPDEKDGKLKLKETWELIQEERLKRGMGLDPNLPVPYHMRKEGE